jgi:hypothetical protein
MVIMGVLVTFMEVAFVYYFFPNKMILWIVDTYLMDLPVNHNMIFSCGKMTF